jgi:adenosylcobinamide-phosphate synthase
MICRALLSTAALLIGFILDLLFGDPRSLPHLIRGMGKLIQCLEYKLRRLLPRTARGELWGGGILAFFMVLLCGALPILLLRGLYRLWPWAGLLLEGLLCWQLLATRSLKEESMKVYDALTAGDLPGARLAVSMIVGRDTASLDATGVTRAAVETVAENTADGSVAPLFYIMLGGAGLGCFYKAVNTMDSMLGYKNRRYLYFGRAAARLDDLVNLIPARLAALLMIIGAFLLGFDGKQAWRVFLRDRKNHASPNAAHTEAVCAGALGVELAGDAWYFGQLYPKPVIGDALRPIEPADILRAHRLLYCAACLMLVLALTVRALLILAFSAFWS